MEELDSLNVAAALENTASVPATQCHWDETVARNVKRYLICREYPSDLPTSETNKRRNFRKRAKDFVVQNDTLYYVDKKDGHLRLAIYSKEEQERVFHVSSLFLVLTILLPEIVQIYNIAS